LIEIVEQLLGPIKVFADDNISLGDIVSLDYSGNGVSCKLSNSLSPFGIVVGERDEWGQVLIMCNTSVLKTDNYDSSFTYRPGDFIYSSEAGRLTNCKSQENSLLLGHVLSAPQKDDSVLEINWI
jgi:hypothetical protein